MTSSLQNHRAVALINVIGRGNLTGGDMHIHRNILEEKEIAKQSLTRFSSPTSTYAVVLYPNDTARWDAAGTPINHTMHAGAMRDAPVRAGLAARKADSPRVVLIPDAARPLVPQTVIGDVRHPERQLCC